MGCIIREIATIRQRSTEIIAPCRRSKVVVMSSYVELCRVRPCLLFSEQRFYSDYVLFHSSGFREFTFDSSKQIAHTIWMTQAELGSGSGGQMRDSVSFQWPFVFAG